MDEPANTGPLAMQLRKSPIEARRSALMARVRQRDTAPEMLVRKAAHGLGLRFRLQRRDLPGTPDLVFPSRRLALFVHGCFWHRHPNCPRCTSPKTRMEYWEDKFAANVARDRRVTDELEAIGWQVEVVWECETIDPERLLSTLNQVFKIEQPPRLA